jgi:hypothetical protein
MILETNDTLRFILPMLYTKNYNNDFFYNQYFLGAFMSDINNPILEDKLLLVYQYIPEAEYITFEMGLQDHPNYDGQYEYEGQDVAVYVFDIPTKFQGDYILINEAKFANISPSLKLNISKMWNLSSQDMLFEVLTGGLDYLGEPFDKQIFNIEEYDYNDLYEQVGSALETEESGTGSSGEAAEFPVW